MALADIISRIEADTAAEVAALLAAAEQRAAAGVADAEARAKAHVAEVTGAAEKAARREADTVVVNARLAARDSAVASRHVLIDAALEAAAASLAALPDDAYASFMAARIAEAARGGETLKVGSADAARAAIIVEELARVVPGLSVTLSQEEAPFARGALLEGPRVRADLSLTSLVEERRDDLEIVVSRALLGEGA